MFVFVFQLMDFVQPQETHFRKLEGNDELNKLRDRPI